jgi:hypothetical protein
LLAGLTDSTDEIDFPPQSGQFTCLCHVIEIVAGSGLIVSPVITAVQEQDSTQDGKRPRIKGRLLLAKR